MERLSAEQREALQAAMFSATHNGHLFAPGECEDGSVDPRWCDECGQNRLPDVSAVVAQMLADERERIAREIEAAAARRHGVFAADEDETLAAVNARLGIRMEPAHHNRHDDGCSMCGIASAARIARSQP